MFTLLWVLWALAFCLIEGVALVNSTRGDTLSEHVWAWLGLRRGGGRVTPKWTLRLARFTFCAGLMWLVIHLTTNWM